MRRTGFLLLTVLAALLATVAPRAVAAPSPAPAHWRVLTLPGRPGLSGVACPSESVCVAVTRTGPVYTTRDASAAHPTWRRTAGRATNGPGANEDNQSAQNLACPSTSLCVTSDGSRILATRNPTGPASAWHSVDLKPGGDTTIDALSCPTTRLCVAGLNEGNLDSDATELQLATTTNPAGPRSAWTLRKPPPQEDYVGTLACAPGSTTCAFGGGEGDLRVTTDPTGPPASWAYEGVQSPSTLTCPTATLCLGVGDNGTLLHSTAPTTRRSWQDTALPRSGHARPNLTTLSCAMTRFCVAVGADGFAPGAANGVFTSTHPAVAADYRFEALPVHGASLNSIACRPGGLCVAVGDRGVVAVGRAG